MYTNSIYYDLIKKGHNVNQGDCPWGNSLEINTGEIAKVKLCFDVPKENVSFMLHIYNKDPVLCKDSSETCQEKLIRVPVKRPEGISFSEPKIIAPPIESQGDIAIAPGASISGCEENNSCYVPYRFDAGKGSIIKWHNVDSAAHTVTSGTPSHGKTGNFDSGVVQAGTIYSHKFEKIDVVNYFCTIHPWMTGLLNISRSGEVIGNDEGIDSSTVPKDTTSPTILKPENIVLDVQHQNGEIVIFDVVVTDDSDRIIRPSCNPKSGSLFAIGSTTVTCNAIDTSGNRAVSVSFSVTVNFDDPIIPSWVKNLASFWCAESIDTDSFVEAIQYLIKNKIISVDSQSGDVNSQVIPEWVKNNACWWSEDAISEDEMILAIQYLDNEGIIKLDSIGF